MPTTHGSRKLPLREAAGLADLYSVSSDLELAVELCDSALAMQTDRCVNAMVVEALVSAALIRYMRCFSQSPRRGLKHEEIGRRS